MSEQKKLLSELTTLEKEDVKDALISGLRSRPNAKSMYGAKGLTADELKKQYDKYPEILRARFNDLVEAIKASLNNADENGSQIAEEIMVVVNGFSVPRRTNTLANAIKDMIERILGAETTADEAKSKAVNAEENATAAVESADYARTVAEEAIGVARTAEGIADQAIGISKGANQAEVFDTEEEMFEWIGDNHSALGHTVTPTTKLIVAADTELITVIDTDGYNGVEVGDEIPPNTCFLNIVFTDGTILGESYITAPFNVAKDESTGRTYANFELYSSYYDMAGKTIKSVRAEFGLLGSYAGDRRIRKNLTYRTYDEPKTINDLIIWHPYEIYDKPIGTNLLIRDLGVPDYWWDGEQAQVLETQKADLKDYATIEKVEEAKSIAEEAKSIAEEAKSIAEEAIQYAQNISETSPFVDIDFKTLQIEAENPEFEEVVWVDEKTVRTSVGYASRLILTYGGFANVKIKVSFRDGDGPFGRSVTINGETLYVGDAEGDEDATVEYSGYIDTIVLEGSYLTSFTFEKFAGEIEPTLKGLLEEEFAKKEEVKAGLQLILDAVNALSGGEST